MTPSERRRPVVLDARMWCMSGVGTYLRGLAVGMHAHGMAAGVERVGVPGDGCGAPPIYSLREQGWYLRLGRRCRGRLFHVPHYNAPLHWPGPLVVTVHDLAHLRCSEAARRRGAWWYAQLMLRWVARRADAIICVSDYTRRDLLAFAPYARGRVAVIHNGVDEDLRPPGERERCRVLQGRGLRPGYVLYLGNVRPHKNIDGLIEAWRTLPSPRPPLVLAGEDQMPAGWAGRTVEGVRLLGRVAREDRAALYAAAGVFCFPSRFEGFGLPPLEAMRCGAPVVCSDATSLPEVVGDAALLVDPRRPEAIGAAIARVLRDPALAAELRRRGQQRASCFTWAAVARATWRVYTRAVTRWRAAREGRARGDRP